MCNSKLMKRKSQKTGNPTHGGPHDATLPSCFQMPHLSLHHLRSCTNHLHN